jgi:integrase
MAETHSLMGDKLHVYKRENSSVWQCSTFLNGRNYRKSTKEDSLSRAKEVAEDWYLELRGKSRAGLLKSNEKTFNEAADVFESEYEIITQGERNAQYVASHKLRLKAHLRPFLGDKGLSEFFKGIFQEYRVHRFKKNEEAGKTRPSRSVLHHETVTARLVLKTAMRKGWISALPDLSEPYKANQKVKHRAWFSPLEYRQLYLATRERAKTADPSNGRWKWEREQFHDYVLFMGNTGLRPDEAARIEFRDVKIVKDRDSGETILEIEVRGKRGTGYCKSTTGAVRPFRRVLERLRKDPAAPGQLRKPVATDLLFPGGARPRELMNSVLDELGLKKDREGNLRTAYSLRHTYISIRLMEGADIYQIAKNCRTSVEMIEKFYAAHLKTTLDATAINVRKQRSGRDAQSIEDIATRLARLEHKAANAPALPPAKIPLGA